MQKTVVPQFAAETWGVSGPRFLFIYLVAATVVFLSIRGLRRREGSAHKGRRPSLSGTETAYLAGGPRRAIAAALVALRSRHLVEADNQGILRTTGSVPRDAEPLEHAVWEAVYRDAAHRIRQLAVLSPVKQVLRQLETRLISHGLYLSPAQRLRSYAYGLAMVLVLAVGVARWFAGVSNDRPVGYLTAELLVVCVLTIWVFVTVPRRTGAGDKFLRRQRKRYQHMKHLKAESFPLYKPKDAALGVGLFGAAALIAIDPDFIVHSQVGSYGGSTGSGSSSSFFSSSSDSGGTTSNCGSGGDSGGGGGGCGG